jgi:hypothetical protein
MSQSLLSQSQSLTAAMALVQPVLNHNYHLLNAQCPPWLTDSGDAHTIHLLNAEWHVAQ